MNKLFVYGIFLEEPTRRRFGMSNPSYATVTGYITIGVHIVQAVPVNNQNIALTGLLVDVDPNYWERIDSIEAGYDRIEVTLTDYNKTKAWMYVRPRRFDEQERQKE